jgi:hypothetical protein
MGDSGEYRRGARIGHLFFMASLNRGVSLPGLEAMRDRAAEAFTARSRSPGEQDFYRGFDDTFGVYLDDLPELEQAATSSPLCTAPAGLTAVPSVQAGTGHPEMEAGA